jgi:hypothetical protein
MFYLITVCKSNPNDQLNINQMMIDSAQLLETINFIQPIILAAAENTVLALNFRLKEIVQQSFVIVVYLPNQIEIQENALVQSILNRLQTIGLRQRYHVSSLVTSPVYNPAAHRQTNNQQLCDLHGFDQQSVPQEYICQLTQEVMDLPVKLPGVAGTYVDYRAISTSLTNNPVNPFDRTALTLDDLEIDTTLKLEIDLFIKIDVCGSELVEKINAGLDINEELHKVHLSNEGNPYGLDRQRYNLATSRVSMWRNITKSNPAGQVIERYREEVEFININYPHPSKTKLALKDYLHAICSRNVEKYTSLVNLYPNEVRKYFHILGNRNGLRQLFSEPAPRPSVEGDDIFLEPRRERVLQINR